MGDVWTPGTIEAGQTIGYSVDCGDIPIVNIIWAENGSPESGYTSDIVGSVFHKDAQTIYKQYGKTDDFLNKDKSHSDNPKAVEVDITEKKIKIHINGTVAGTFAIKVVEVTQ
jgi:hypothetical protein